MHVYSRAIDTCSSVFFFFQAEDGIRDHCVTGVQTCALPICEPEPRNWRGPYLRKEIPADPWGRAYVYKSPGDVNPDSYDRSEERRVGKECRSRWWPECEKKKTDDGRAKEA